MNMRKFEYKMPLKSPVTLLLWVFAPLILLSSLALLHTVETAAPITKAQAAYLGGLLEYHAAAMMLLTAGASLLHFASRKK